MTDEVRDSDEDEHDGDGRADDDRSSHHDPTGRARMAADPNERVAVPSAARWASTLKPVMPGAIDGGEDSGQRRRDLDQPTAVVGTVMADTGDSVDVTGDVVVEVPLDPALLVRRQRRPDVATEQRDQLVPIVVEVAGLEVLDEVGVDQATFCGRQQFGDLVDGATDAVATPRRRSAARRGCARAPSATAPGDGPNAVASNWWSSSMRSTAGSIDAGPYAPPVTAAIAAGRNARIASSPSAGRWSFSVCASPRAPG